MSQFLRPTLGAFRVALSALMVGLALGASDAHAAGDLQTGIADDRLLLAGDATVAPLARTLAGLGVDSVRLHARWVSVAPAPQARRKPAGFDAADPSDPGYNWAALDLAIRELRVNNIEPILAVTGSGPLWSSRSPELGNPRYKPDPRLFGQFAGAVARRYGAQVGRYLVWNEPNIPTWLQPQNTCRNGRCVATAPHLYRELLSAGTAAIRSADPAAKIMFGTLSPRGSNPTSRNAKTRPLAFLRAMGCVTASYRRDRIGPCAAARAVRVDGFSYHPHPVFAAPDEIGRHRDDAAIGDLARLKSVLDRTTDAGVIKPRTGKRFDIHLTEFGYQTNPPDPTVGVSVLRQAQWVQQATYIAWKDPRVKTITQYEYQDEPIKTNSSGTDAFASWQSGLLFHNGRPKPLLAAFPNPFFVDVTRGRSTARFWGQVRPGAGHAVRLQRRAGTSWTTLRELQTTATGFWSLQLAVRSRGEYRFAYTVPAADAGGAVEKVSAVQRVRPG